MSIIIKIKYFLLLHPTIEIKCTQSKHQIGIPRYHLTTSPFHISPVHSHRYFFLDKIQKDIELSCLHELSPIETYRIPSKLFWGHDRINIFTVKIINPF